MLEYFTKELPDPLLEGIGTREIKGYLAWRRVRRKAGKGQTASAEPVSNRTLQKDRAVLHRLFDFAYRLELIEGNPVARVEQPIVDERSAVILTDQQFETLLTKCEDRPQLWLYSLVLNEVGARAYSEALHLQWVDVDLTEGFIEIRSGARKRGEKVHRTKSGKSRFVPMTDRLKAAMKEHAARLRFATYNGQQSPWIFHHETTRRGCKAGDRVKSFRQAFDKAADAAGIPDTFHRHDLRHRRVTTWLAEGQNPVHVKEALGHSDLKTTMHYTHLSKEHLRSLVAPKSTPASADEKKA